MDDTLLKLLPFELVLIIEKMVHKLNLKKVHDQLLHGVVWILADGERSFWVCNVYNRYSILSDDEIWKKINEKKKKLQY